MVSEFSATSLAAWLVLAGLILAVTTLFAPSANPVALGLSVLPLAVLVWLGRGAGALPALPRVLKPILSGLLAALPAAGAVLIAVLA